MAVVLNVQDLYQATVMADAAAAAADVVEEGSLRLGRRQAPLARNGSQLCV